MTGIFKLHDTFDSTLEEVDRHVRKVCAAAYSDDDFPQNSLFLFDYTLRELFNNAVEHGNRSERSKKVAYTVTYAGRVLTIVVRDEGTGFSLSSIGPEDCCSEPLRCRKRGLASLMEMGFFLKAAQGEVMATLDLATMNQLLEREGVLMDVSYRENTVICSIGASLVGMNIKELVEQMKKVIEDTDDYELIQLDLSQSATIDSMGITFLVGVYKELAAKGRKLKLTGLSNAMLQLFKMMKLDEVFELGTV